MRTPSEWFDAYGASHQHPVNKAIHWVCIPVIVLSTLGLLQSVPFPGEVPGLHFASLAVLGAVVFYASLSWTLAVGMAVIGAACLAINAGIVAAGLPLFWASVGVFFVAWVLQFVGHRIEGEKPSFFEDLQFLLIGPAWLLQFIYKRVGIPVETPRIAPAGR